MPLTDRDGWQAVQEPAHDLKACLRCRVRATGDDDRPIARATRIARAANPLRQAADEPDRGGRSERRPVVMVDLVAQARIADLIESKKLIEAQRAAVWHQEPVKPHCEPGLSKRLNGSRLAEDARPRRNEHVLSAVGVHRIRDQAVDRGCSASVEAVGQYRVDESSLEQRVQRTSRADWVRSVRRAFLSAVGAGSKASLPARKPGRLWERPDAWLPRSSRL